MSSCSLSNLGGVFDRAATISCGSDAVMDPVTGRIITRRWEPSSWMPVVTSYQKMLAFVRHLRNAWELKHPQGVWTWPWRTSGGGMRGPWQRKVCRSNYAKSKAWNHGRWKEVQESILWGVHLLNSRKGSWLAGQLEVHQQAMAETAEG